MQLIRPLLAAKTDGYPLDRLPFPMLGSVKIDGIRALISGGRVLSRSMKPIRNRHTQLLFGMSKLEGLDGELVVGEPFDQNLMQQTSSAVMSIEGRPAVKYYVFDKWDEPRPFIERWELAGGVVRCSDLTNVIHLPQFLIPNYDTLIEFEQNTLAQGYEGVMLRSLNGKYKQNRSTIREGILLKIKRFHDGEAIVTGVEPLYRNGNPAMVDERGFTKRSSDSAGMVSDEQLGALVVRDLVTRTVFNIGTGFTTLQRKALWEAGSNSLTGRIVKYKSFKVGVKDAPRFPVFLGFRDPIDM